jgi:hypothetical protein
VIHNFIISLYIEDDEKQNKSICEILYEHIIFVSLQCILQESKYDASYYNYDMTKKTLTISKQL